jgi:hypothetical protein
MPRGSFLIVIVLAAGFSLIPSAQSRADEPKQADIESCNKEATLRGESGTATSSNEERSSGSNNGSMSAARQAPASTPRGADEVRSGTAAEGTADSQPGSVGINAPHAGEASAASREAFAACLARHGYYKGYYHQ